jgi:thiol:disulfide interchange protein DsbC
MPKNVKNITQLALLLTAACWHLNGWPQDDALAAARAEAVRKFPGQTVISVRKTPVEGRYAVVLAPAQVAASGGRSDYVLTRATIDIPNRTEFAESRPAPSRRIDFAQLPLERAIKTVRGNGERKIAVFSDPDCPYCKRLERETLSKADNITIYTFLFPLDQHSDAQRKSGLIWCAPDRDQAWRDWMQAGALPVMQGACATPLASNLALGRKLGVHATPTLIFSQGDLLPGAIDMETLELKLGK